MLKNVKESLNKLAKYVVQQSRSNLTKNKKNVSKSLYNSIDYNLNVSPNSFSLSFIMDEYGMYQDKGVSGKKKKYNTPFRYTNKMPPIKPLADWAKFKNIRLRNEKGQYSKGSYQTIGFLIARSIFNKGIKPSLFFTKPFEASFKNLPNEVVEAFNLDIKDLLQFTTR
tara:strand:+ start:1315 stop:1818 length:504 start_codon:yes stop_codon:yes gene_type:complete